MKKEEAAELARLCRPVAAFLKKNCSPHDTVIITDEQMKMVSDEWSFPVSVCEWSASGPSNADGQSGL